MKLKNTIKLIVGNTIVFILLLICGEMALRIIGYKPHSVNLRKPMIEVEPGGKYFQKDSILGYKHLGGKFKVRLKKDYEFVTSHDSLTNRLTALSENGAFQGKPEIWIFGCSYTHGWSINDNETFPWLIQSRLTNYKIINWGVSGYGTIHFYLQLKEALEKRQNPSLVVISHASFHLQRNVFSFKRRRTVDRWNFLGSLNQPYAKLDKDGNMHFLHSNVEYLPWKWSRNSSLIRFIQTRYENYLDKKNEQTEIDVTEKILTEILKLCRAYQVKLLISNITGEVHSIQKYCISKGIPFVDISVNLQEKGNTNSPIDGHPSAKANKIYAKKIIAFLKENSSLNIN